MKLMLVSILMFAVTFIMCTIFCTIIWGYTMNDFYDCTDDGNFLAYLQPGFVHEFGGRHVVTVSQIVHGRSMSDPDTIKQGWSVTRLWSVWFLFVGVSVVISLLVGSIILPSAFYLSSWTLY